MSDEQTIEKPKDEDLEGLNDVPDDVEDDEAEEIMDDDDENGSEG